MSTVKFMKYWLGKYGMQLSAIAENNIFHTENSLLEHIMLQHVVAEATWVGSKWETTMYLYPFYHDLGKITTYSSDARNAKGHEELSTDFIFQDAEYLKELFGKEFSIHLLLFLVRNHNPYSFDEDRMKTIKNMPEAVQRLHTLTLHFDNESKLSTNDGYTKNRKRFKTYLENNFPEYLEDYFQ